MATSDGISDADWQLVRQYAEEIVEASSNGVDSHLLSSNFMRLLKRLEKKYGRLPSILATTADYTEDAIYEMSLLKEAYITACELNDKKNKSYISASLAEYYIEQMPDNEKHQYWLMILLENSKKYTDDYIDSVIAEFANGKSMGSDSTDPTT